MQFPPHYVNPELPMEVNTGATKGNGCGREQSRDNNESMTAKIELRVIDDRSVTGQQFLKNKKNRLERNLTHTHREARTRHERKFGDVGKISNRDGNYLPSGQKNERVFILKEKKKTIEGE